MHARTQVARRSAETAERHADPVQRELKARAQDLEIRRRRTRPGSNNYDRPFRSRGAPSLWSAAALWLRDPCEKQIFAEETKGINSGTYFMESNVGPAAPSRKKFKSINGADSTPDSGEVVAAESVQTGLFDPEAEGALVLLNTPTAVVVVDPYISRTLREHQRAGVRFM